jgi:hypothetical protein
VSFALGCRFSTRLSRAYGRQPALDLFSDDSCGISLGVRRQAFDPFFTTRRDQGGTGTKIQIILPRVAPRAVAAAIVYGRFCGIFS